MYEFAFFCHLESKFSVIFQLQSNYFTYNYLLVRWKYLFAQQSTLVVEDISRFREFKKNRNNVKLIIVDPISHSYCKDYIDYRCKVWQCVSNDSHIEIHNLTNNLDQIYGDADVLLNTMATPIANASATLFKCIVFPPSLPRVPSFMHDGMFMRWSGKRCSKSFSTPNTVRPHDCTPNLLPGVIVGLIP